MLFGEERKTAIVKHIHEHGRGIVQELSQVFHVSESTIRRDLKELEEENLITRTHGGAIPAEGVNFEPTFNEKEDKFANEKKAIAKRAVQLIKEGDTILVDSGTTTLPLVEELKTLTNITVVTNSLVVGELLKTVKEIEVVILGGSIRPQTLALVGPLTERSLEYIHVDKVFIATNGIDMKEGLTTPNLIEAATKQKMIKAAKQKILLADHSKIGKVSFGKFAKIEDLDVCIVDAKVPSAFVKALEDRGVDVDVVNV